MRWEKVTLQGKAGERASQNWGVRGGTEMRRQSKGSLGSWLKWSGLTDRTSLSVNALGPHFPLVPFPLLPNTGPQRASSLSGHSRSTVSILEPDYNGGGGGHKATCTANLGRSATPEVATYHSQLGKTKTPGMAASNHPCPL